MLAEIKALFSPRENDTHKGTYGTVLSVCGSYGMAGAAFLSAKAALRCGAGLVVAAVPHSVYPLLAPMLPEAVFAPYDEAKAAVSVVPRLVKSTALLCGCGLGQSREAAELTAALLCEAECPIVLDADGINIVARHIHSLEAVKAPLVLTPHPLELARLLDCSVSEIQANREAVAKRAAKQLNAVVVLKGYHTVVATPSGDTFINPTGNPGMAVGGSGDVLAGMIASFLAQGFTPWDAARAGVYLHGAAGDAAAARLSQHAMLPTDMLEELGTLFLKLEQTE